MTKYDALQEIVNTAFPSSYAYQNIKIIIDKIYDDFEKELKQAYIVGSDANYKCIKDSGMIK